MGTDLVLGVDFRSVVVGMGQEVMVNSSVRIETSRPEIRDRGKEKSGQVASELCSL